MIEDLIETGQYKEALQYLNDMDNEQVRYQRLVCLYGLKELQQAKREGMKAKVLAGETYYDVVAIYVSILKDLEEFEEAINIISEFVPKAEKFQAKVNSYNDYINDLEERVLIQRKDNRILAEENLDLKEKIENKDFEVSERIRLMQNQVNKYERLIKKVPEDIIEKIQKEERNRKNRERQEVNYMSQIVKEEKLVYTAQEVAKILHASPNYVYELIRKGKLKAFKLKSIRILKSALEDFLKQNEGNDLSDIDNVRRLSKYEDNER